MKLYREENIEAIYKAIQEDEYDDTMQDVAIEQDDFLPELKNFLDMYIIPGRVLEVGCGSGDSFKDFPNITHGLEPNERRVVRARIKGTAHGIDVKQGMIEYMDYTEACFHTIMMINGFWQVRSDYEALMEVNRCLQIGGHFILNLLVNDNIDVVLGRVYGHHNFIRTASQFGFSLVAYYRYNAGARFYPQEQIGVAICFEKVLNFDYKMLNLPQVDKKNVMNYLHSRDWRLI